MAPEPPRSNFERALGESLTLRSLEAVSLSGLDELKQFIPDVNAFGRELNRAWAEPWHAHAGGSPVERGRNVLSELRLFAVQLKAFRQLLEADERDERALREAISNTRAYLPEKILLFASDDKPFQAAVRSIFQQAFADRPDWLETLERKSAICPEMKWVSPRRFVGKMD